MRLIRPMDTRRAARSTVILALLMLIVGCTALALMSIIPTSRPAPIALLALSAALGLGVGCAISLRAFSAGRRRTKERGDDLVRLLAPAFDDSYVLIVSPRLPGVPGDLAALLVGPPGVRALIARRWHGSYRVRGRGWDYDTRTRAGWVPCITNPSFDARTVVQAVTRWAGTTLPEAPIPVAGTIAFPRQHSRVVLEEPDLEVVTTDNAPWWAQLIGRVQRMDGQRVGRFVEAVLEAGKAESRRPSPAPTTQNA